MNGLIPNEFTIEVSSDPGGGATSISPDGSIFTMSFDDPITVPRGAKNITCQVQESRIWNVTPNILEGTNDIFYCTGPNVGDVLTNFEVIVPEGLYDLNELNNAILEGLQNLGAKIDPSPIIDFSEDISTSRVRHTFNYAGSAIDFTGVDNMHIIMGYDEVVVSPIGPIFPQSALAPNIAEFNQLESYQVHSDISDNGIRVGTTFEQVIGTVSIDVPPGSQIIARDFHPARSNISGLTNQKKLKFWLTDSRGDAVDTFGEFWSVRLLISYLEPFNSPQQK